MKLKNMELVRTGSHSVTLDHRGLQKEEVYLYFVTEWRGKPASVIMACDRYRHSEGLSEWRVYASEAREHTNEEGKWGAYLTDTARQRMGEALRPFAMEWLTSTAYANSESNAYGGAILRMMHGATPWVGDLSVTKAVRAMVKEHSGKLYPRQRGAINDAATAFARFAEAYNVADEANKTAQGSRLP